MKPQNGDNNHGLSQPSGWRKDQRLIFGCFGVNKPNDKIDNGLMDGVEIRRYLPKTNS